MDERRPQRAHQDRDRGRGGARRARGARMTRARIIGLGSYAPKRILTNADLEKMVATDDAWIVQRTGVREHRITDETQPPSALALTSAHRSLDRADIRPQSTRL